METTTEERKYYIPEKEEFHIGFEYEFRRAGESEEDWKSSVIVDGCQIDDIFARYCSLSGYRVYKLRVPYLDRQGIEECGWIYTGRSVDLWFRYPKLPVLREDGHHYEDLRLQYNALDHNLIITAKFTEGDSELIVNRMKVLNKSELRQIMKMIGV